MKVYVGSLYKIETESCSGKSGSSKILALLPLLGPPGLQVNEYFGGIVFSKGLLAEMVFDAFFSGNS